MAVQPAPDHFRTVTPYLLVEGVPKLASFLQEAFGAEEKIRLKRGDGSIMHVEMQLGDSMVMMGEPMAEFGPMPTSIYLSVEDCDSVYERALKVGGTHARDPHVPCRGALRRREGPFRKHLVDCHPC